MSDVTLETTHRDLTKFVPSNGASIHSADRSFSSINIARTARVLFIVLATISFAYFARPVVVPILLAWVLAMTLKDPVRWLKRCHIPTPIAAGLIVTLFVASAGFCAVRLGSPAVEWFSTAPENLPRIKAKFQNILKPAARLSEAASSVGKLTNDKPTRETVEVKDNQVANTLFTWTGSLLAGATETVALLFMLLASGDLFLHKFVRVMPRLRDKKQAVEISRELQQSISTYLFSVGIINVCFGVVVAFALHLLGMPNAVMWGGVAAFSNFIPYLGPILGMTAVGVAGLLAFDSVAHGILPVAAYGVLHLIESYVVTPTILGRRFALNPVVIFVTLIFCTWLWGMVGTLLAVPLLVTLRVVSDRVPALSVVGELLRPLDCSECWSM